MTADAWRITGGKPLHGRVALSGSKNGALPTLAAALLLDGEMVFHNVPRIADAEVMFDLLRALGLEVEAGPETVRVVNRGLRTHRAPAELVGRMRASHYVLGPVLARLGRAELPLPGGCDLGDRPMDYILRAIAPFGADLQERPDRIEATASRLTGARVTLDPKFRSPGATFAALMSAVLADGVTTIEHACFEPDVVRFCEFLNAAGAQVQGAGGETLTVTGVSSLRGTAHRVNSDRLEAGTLLCAAAATRGEVLVEHITLAELGGIAAKLTDAGMRLEEVDGGVQGRCGRRLRGTEVLVAPFPEFPTDLQPPLGAVLATAEGASTIRESIFNNRLQYVPELRRMGAEIEQHDAWSITIRGVPRLHGAEVAGGNIRDGAALVVAALGAEGESVVSGRRYVSRGYQRFEGKLRSLGAEVEAVDEP
jgi:UDP-N-acetylglucosamine 1-carboxyvinyltransferase